MHKSSLPHVSKFASNIAKNAPPDVLDKLRELRKQLDERAQRKGITPSSHTNSENDQVLELGTNRPKTVHH